MNPHHRTAIGIDVGGRGKGFHAVALRDGEFEAQHFTAPVEAAAWCQARDAQVIAIDAPSGWAASGGSRLAERSLAMDGVTIQCFKTPTKIAAFGRKFYGWVFNGEALYRSLLPNYQLFDGTRQRGRIVLETFPHAVACAFAGRVIPARPKATTRRRIIREQGFDDRSLSNIDFVDAALCALTAERFLLGRTRSFGTREEGFIVVPSQEAV